MWSCQVEVDPDKEQDTMENRVSIKEKLQSVCDVFQIPGTLFSYEEISVGNVNSTYKVNYLCADGAQKSYMIQDLNTYVFKSPIEVMENIHKVTEYIRQKHPEKVSMRFYHTGDGNTYYLEKNRFWRLFDYISSDTYNVTNDLDVVRSAGEAFGEFQMMLGDFDASRLHETIVGFHDTCKRYEKLADDVRKDPLGRVAEVSKELEWLFSVKDKACSLTDMYQRNELPLRVTHNDAKINNVLFDKESKKALVVIDLDTVMPGLVGNDFGDAIRFAANYVAEDCPEYDKAGINMEVFAAFAEGFLEKTAKTLTRNEIDTLALSCFTLTTELAVRFLDDYILGDPYFKTDYPEHNLVRTRCQIGLAQDMLARMEDMESVIREAILR